MELKLCLKISYLGLMRYIISDVDSRYEDLIKIIIERFNIPEDYQKALKITNENGYIFDKHLLEYFIILFPNPKIIFYIRLDYTKIECIPSSNDHQDSRLPFGNSKLNNKRSRSHLKHDDYEDDNEVIEDEYQFSPVHRQNCFIGSLPSTSTAAIKRQQEVEFSRQVSKRMRIMDCDKKKSMKSLKAKPQRSLRI